MPPQLLPASAAAFAPRASSVNVVLGSKVEPWLTQTLKRINRVKRPLNNVPQHQRCLTETLSSENAIWTLASLMVTKAPETELRKDDNPLVEALFNYQLITVEAYIVHVDMVLRNEVAFKLTPDTIETLIEYHKDIHCVDAKANTYDWSDKEQQCKKLHNDFVQAVNKYVFRTHVSALEGLEEDGAGELLCGKSDEVKSSIFAMFKPLLPPPPPKVVDVFRQPPLLPSNSNANLSSIWAQHAFASSIAHPHPAMAAAAAAAAAIAATAATAASITTSMPAPVDSWRVLPSSPNVSATSVDSNNTIWANMGMQEMHDEMHQLQQQQQHMSPSPPLAYSQPYSTAGLFYGSSPLVSAPLPQLPLPSMLAPQCGVSVGYGGFGWDRYQEYTTTI
ncbi:hypothetical protein SPI_00442 [Niveomyces insectorum RCEF 264]|uniref:Uncharacterized protein n=1 Tax=Niveomyces insectorum RCEF 264 TaxID=1081102 RepID=A0A168A4S9_9HYPO|nr:hypothetical protein SPI_00442 [Niveomyces insectorum RCEF 264]